MDLEETIKNYRWQNLDPLGYWLSKLDDDQKELIIDCKKNFNRHIREYSETVDFELQRKIDVHISNKAKIELLEKRHKKIVNKKRFLEAYRGILNTDINGFTFIINDDLYNEFIMSFEVVGLSSQWVNEIAELRAKEYLENVATLNIIETKLRMLKEDEVFGNQRFKDVPEWQRILAKLANRFETNLRPTSKFTVIHLWMRNNKMLKNIDATVYRRHVKEKHLNKENDPKFTAFTKIDEKHQSYKNSIEQLDQINKSV